MVRSFWVSPRRGSVGDVKLTCVRGLRRGLLPRVRGLLIGILVRVRYSLIYRGDYVRVLQNSLSAAA